MAPRGARLSVHGLLLGILVVAAGFLLLSLVGWWRRSLGIVLGVRARLRIGDRDIERVAAYHRALPARAPDDVVDDRTWADLDMDQLMLAVDRTASMPGAQWLYDRLRIPVIAEDELERFDAAVERMRSEPALAERVRRELAPLSRPGASYLPDLFVAELPARPAFHWLFLAFPIAMTAACAATALWPRALLAVAAIGVVNYLLTLAFKERVQAIVPALRAVPPLVRAGRRLSDIAAPELERESSALRSHAASLLPLRGAARWLLFEPGEANDLAASLYEYANTIFLFGVNAFVFGVGQARARRDAVRAVFGAIGALDTYQAVATLRDEWTPWCRPEPCGDDAELDVEHLWHPLLAAPVANSIRVPDSSLLVTGSNMSGKTTFIRTAGVAALLARTIHTVPARRWRAPPLMVRTSIGRSDSLLEGKSYYLAEVERIAELLATKGRGRRQLFLLDEILRGTNTTERIAAGRAVLAELDRGDDIVIVATHDLELLPLLAGRYLPFHFREEVVDGALTFDYAIRPGPSSSRNAIALLRLMGYPDRVVREAMETVETLGERSV